MRWRAIFLVLLCLITILPTRTMATEELFPAFTYEGCLSYDVAGMTAGTRVRLFEAEHEKYYIVSAPSGGRVRVPWDAVEPIEKAVTMPRAVSAEEIAAYAGAHMYSKTDFLLWVDLTRKCTYVLEYGDEGWALLRTLRCSVGDFAHPTPSGRYEIAYRSSSIGKEDLYLCRYALCFYGGYMLHSVLYDWSGNAVKDGRLGEHVSHGCIRHAHEDSYYLFRTIPIGTAIYIR